MKSAHTGWTRLIAFIGYSLQGLTSAYHHQAVFRQEIWLTMVVIAADASLDGCYLGARRLGLFFCQRVKAKAVTLALGFNIGVAALC